ncbi:NXPE family member 1-like [Lissotriton helveticus]
MKKILTVGVIITTLILLTYYMLQTSPLIAQIPSFRYLYESCKDAPEEKVETEARPTETDLKTIEIFSRVDAGMPKALFIGKNQTTSASHSRATILNPQNSYCVGDNLTVQVQVYDFSGNQKEHGGDYLRARIYSPELKAGASGAIEDLNNGTYHIHFTLFWEGKVRVSILLMHSSEAVSALWRARNKGYEKLYWIGKFVNGTKEVQAECGLKLNSTEELCEYKNHCHGEVFYCLRPSRVPCEELKAMVARYRKHSYLSDSEKSLFDNSNNGVEIKPLFDAITVSSCNRTLKLSQEKCRTGMSSPFPSGFFLQNVWQPLFCKMSSYERAEELDPCVKGKQMYLMGDSTMRQWITLFPKLVPGLRFFDLHNGGEWHRNHLAVDMERNLRIFWKKHGHPFVTMSFFPIPNDACVVDQINELMGNSYTVVVITVAHHFRPLPLEVFIRRVIRVRSAVERLLRRSPETKVILKTGNTRELHTDAETNSDFHGYVQYLVTKQVFEGLNVGIVDAWDMTVALATRSQHPPEHVIQNHLKMLLTYMC